MTLQIHENRTLGLMGQKFGIDEGFLRYLFQNEAQYKVCELQKAVFIVFSFARLELMHRPDIPSYHGGKGSMNGQAHFAISLGNKDKVDQLTEVLRNDGFEIIGEPRTTGDGYYESVISDPEGNPIELTE